MDMLKLTGNAKKVLTDSGGLQKKPACWVCPALPCGRIPSGWRPWRPAGMCWWERRMGRFWIVWRISRATPHRQIFSGMAMPVERICEIIGK